MLEHGCQLFGPLLILILVYLECRSAIDETAKTGSLQVLRHVSQQWFDDPRLAIETKYSHLLTMSV